MTSPGTFFVQVPSWLPNQRQAEVASRFLLDAVFAWIFSSCSFTFILKPFVFVFFSFCEFLGSLIFLLLLNQFFKIAWSLCCVRGCYFDDWLTVVLVKQLSVVVFLLDSLSFCRRPLPPVSRSIPIPSLLHF